MEFWPKIVPLLGAQDIYGILKSAVPFILSGIIPLAAYIIFWKSKYRQAKSEYLLNEYKNADEQRKMYLAQLKDDTETITNLNKTIRFLKHDNSKKEFHILSLLDEIERHSSASKCTDLQLFETLDVYKKSYDHEMGKKVKGGT